MGLRESKEKTPIKKGIRDYGTRSWGIWKVNAKTMDFALKKKIKKFWRVLSR